MGSQYNTIQTRAEGERRGVIVIHIGYVMIYVKEVRGGGGDQELTASAESFSSIDLRSTSRNGNISSAIKSCHSHSYVISIPFILVQPSSIFIVHLTICYCEGFSLPYLFPVPNTIKKSQLTISPKATTFSPRIRSTPISLSAYSNLKCNLSTHASSRKLATLCVVRCTSCDVRCVIAAI